MAKALASKKPVRLSYEDGHIVVTPQDQDKFLISAERAIQACRETVQMDERITNFKEKFLLPLNRWCAHHASRVAACYLPLPMSSLQAFVVNNSSKFDFELANEVAALERDLARAGWRVGVVQLPAADEFNSLATFFNPEGALEVYAQRGSAPELGAA